jgi:Protein of unknown function (DUF1761)
MTSSSVPIFAPAPILLVATVNFLVGGLWYSPALFGDAFVRMSFGKARAVPHPLAMHVTVLALLVHAPIFCFLLAVVGVANANEGVLWALLLAVFDAGLHIHHGLFENRPFGLTLLVQGQHTIAFLLSGGLLGALYGQGS